MRSLFIVRKLNVESCPFVYIILFVNLKAKCEQSREIAFVKLNLLAFYSFFCASKSSKPRVLICRTISLEEESQSSMTMTLKDAGIPKLGQIDLLSSSKECTRLKQRNVIFSATLPLHVLCSVFIHGFYFYLPIIYISIGKDLKSSNWELSFLGAIYYGK